MPFTYPKGKQLSTGNTLVDILLGLNNPDPTLGPSPMGLGGVFKELIHARLGDKFPSATLKQVEPDIAKALNMALASGGHTTFDDTLLTHLQLYPGFRRFQELIAGNLRRLYGDKVPFFRGLYPDELAYWRGGQKIGMGKPSVLPGSLDEQIGQSFAAARGGPMLKAQVKPEDVIYHTFRNNMWFPERELGIRPRGLIDPVIYDVTRYGNPAHTPIGPPNELLTEILRSMLQKGQY